MKWRLWILMAGFLTAGMMGCAPKAGPATRQAGPSTRTAEPAATMYATKAANPKLVYIVDRSAAVADSFEDLKKELVRSVNGTLRFQQFGVVMLGEKSEAVFPDLQQASPNAKEKLAKRVEGIKAEGDIEGKLEPFKEGFETAFAMKPEIIFLVTGSGFDPRLLKVVDELNKERKVRVNVIAYVRDDEKFQEQLKELAKRNGGQYKVISKEEAKGNSNGK